jgi:hypothetical protein
MKLFDELGLSKREDRLKVTSEILGRDVGSWADTSPDEQLEVITELLERQEEQVSSGFLTRAERDADDRAQALADQLDLDRDDAGEAVRTQTRGVLYAEHGVRHAEWLTPTLPTLSLPVVDAYKELVDELGTHIRRLNRQLVDLELELDGAAYDLTVRDGVIADRDALIADLEADLYRIRSSADP